MPAGSGAQCGTAPCWSAASPNPSAFTAQRRLFHGTAFIQANSHQKPCGERWEGKRKHLAFLQRARPTRAKGKSWLPKASGAGVPPLPAVWVGAEGKAGRERGEGSEVCAGGTEARGAFQVVTEE